MSHHFLNLIYGLPLLIMLLPANIEDMIVYAIFYLVIEANLLNYEQHTKYSSISKKAKMLSVSICVVLGVLFYIRWIPSSKVGSIANAFHLPVYLMMGSMAVVLVVTSYYGVCCLVNGFPIDVLSYLDRQYYKIYCLLLINYPFFYIVPPNNNTLSAFAIVFCSLAVGGLIVKKLFSSSYSIAFMAIMFAVGLKYR